jgi:hypothetical protein
LAKPEEGTEEEIEDDKGRDCLRVEEEEEERPNKSGGGAGIVSDMALCRVLWRFRILLRHKIRNGLSNA